MKSEDNVVTREELITQDYELKCNQKGVEYAEYNGKVLAKECTNCRQMKYLKNFYRKKDGFIGFSSRCKLCAAKFKKIEYEDNKERYSKNRRKRYEANKENELEKKKLYRTEHAERISLYKKKKHAANREAISEQRKGSHKKNPEVYRLSRLRRRARKASLPDKLTACQWASVVGRFGGGCALTGSMEYVREHAIPIAIGHGGTTVENMSPMRSDLNSSKRDAHIFEWFETNREHYGLSQMKFDALISYLAEVNGMTTKEYRMYVDWCFDNPRDIDDLEMGATG